MWDSRAKWSKGQVPQQRRKQSGGVAKATLSTGRKKEDMQPAWARMDQVNSGILGLENILCPS